MVATGPIFRGHFGAHMAIKNWTVRAAGVTGGTRGLTAYGKYLEDPNHRNHRDKTEAIIPIQGNWKQLVVRQTVLMTNRNLNKPKGGRPVETLAQSFVVSLPPDLRPTPEQWAKIAAGAILGLSRGLPEGQELERADIFANVHDNPNNPHLNIVVGKLTASGEIRKGITQKAALHRMKMAVNEAVLRVMGVSNEQYEPRAPRPRTQAEREAQGDYHRRNLTGWQYQRLQDEIAQRIDDRNADLVALDQGFEGLHDEFSRLQKTAEAVGDRLNAKVARRSLERVTDVTFSGEVRDHIAGPAPAPAAPTWRSERDKTKPWRPSPTDDDTGPSGP